MKVVLQKYIAGNSSYSRRQAEELIRKSVETQNIAPVLVNGQPAELGMKVDENDEVKVFGKPIKAGTKKIYIMLNKPAGYVCTNRKFPGEKNIFELIDTPRPGATGAPLSRGELPRLFTVGRLDKDSRGLVLLTNDGDLALRLEHPRHGKEKMYIAIIQNSKFKIQNYNSVRPELTTKAKFKISDEIISKFIYGIDIGDGEGIVKAKHIKYLGSNRFEIVLTTGKKRQIRRMFEAVGYEVEDLIRTEIGNLKLGNLLSGKWRYLEDEEVSKLKNF